MKILPFEIPKPRGATIIYQVDEQERFYDKLHQHKEVQLSIIVKGSGDLFVGDSITRYQKGDILLIGSNLPHLFRSEENPENLSHMITLFFPPELFEEDLLSLPEFKKVKKLLAKLSLGIKVAYKESIMNLFKESEKANDFKRFIILLELLDILSKSKTQVLSSFDNQKKYTEDEGSRMNKVMNLALNQFHHEIKLDEVAELANMTTPAFCRYFKQRTRKTFFEFLLDIRIEHACRLLENQKDLQISDIAIRSGFSNLSNFNRKFKTLKGKTPSEYRKKKLPPA